MTTPAPRADSRFVDMLRVWREREAELVAGKAIPSRRDREAGHSPFQASALLDFRQLVDIELDRDQLPDDLRAALVRCHAVPSASAIWAARALVPDDERWPGLGYLREDLLWHAALRVHRPAVAELLASTLQTHSRYNPVAWTQAVSLALGLVHAGTNESSDDELEAVDVEESRDSGLERLDRLASVLADVNAAMNALDREGDEEAVQSGMVGALAAMKATQENDLNSVEDMLLDIEEDRAEIVRETTLVVVDADTEQKQPGSRADVWKAYKPVIGKSLPLVSTAKVPAARTALHARYPHMHAEIDAILSTQAALQSVRLAVLLVSGPGMGKTTFAREMAELLGVPSMTYSCAGASDGAFGGTSAQWNSARPATPLQLVGRSRTANPLVVLDEVDKIGTSKHNGSLADTLLTFLEPASSKVFFDLALEQPADLSAVSYIATANSLDDVPAALRDRFRIVRIPEPGWQHLGVLTERIIDDLAKDRGLDRRWIEPLAQDEIEIVRKCWPGGSLRQLTTVVTRLVDGRDQLMGRA